MRVLGRMWVYYVFNIYYESIGKMYYMCNVFTTFTMTVLGRMYYMCNVFTKFTVRGMGKDVLCNVFTKFTMTVLGRMWVHHVFNINYKRIGKDVLHV